MMIRGKKSLALLLAVVVGMGTILAEPVTARAATQSVPVQVTYGQSEARTMLDDINSFRTSATDAWAYDASGKKVKYSGLGELTYDYELERVAMKRAAEIAISYGHTRPNGQSCFTAYDYPGGASAENIAAGFTTVDAVFAGWREDNEDYSGQGHRRNMLSEYYKAVGIGHVKYQGVDYWVQEFSSDITDTTDPGAADKATVVDVEIDDAYILGMEVTKGSIALKAGETLDLSDLGVKLTVKYFWGTADSCLTRADYTANVADSSIATYNDHAVTGVKAGNTTLTISACGKTVKLPVTVSAAASAPSTPTTTVTQPTASELKASVALTATSKTLKKGKTCQISFKKKLASEYVSKITYTSSKKSVATVSKKGKVTAKKSGSAVIKCKVVFRGGASKTVNFKVKVK